MIGVILDTNVVVSSFLNTEGAEATVVDLVLAGELRFFVSEPILAEYERTLARPKFSLNSEQVEELVASLRKVAYMIEPDERITTSPDEADNRFLECADVAQAEFLVTGNKRHFPPVWKSTRVVNASELFDLIEFEDTREI